MAHRLACGGKNGVKHCWGHHANGGLTHTAPEVIGGHDDGFDLGHFSDFQDAVGVEVELFHAPVFNRVFTKERGRQAVGHAAFDLRGNLVGVDRVTAVGGQHHAVNFDHATGADRHLSRGRRVAAVAHELRYATEHARRQRLAPVAFVSRRVEHGQMLGVVLQHRAAKRE